MIHKVKYLNSKMQFKYNLLNNNKCSCIVKVKIGDLEYAAVSKVFDDPDSAYFSAEENLRDLLFNNYYKDLSHLIVFINLENSDRNALLLSCLKIRYQLFATLNPLKLDNMVLIKDYQSIDMLMAMHIASYIAENKFTNNQTLVCISEANVENIFECAKTISKEVFSEYKYYSSISEFLKFGITEF